MIKRYSSLEMENIWNDQNKFEAYLKVELASCQAWSKMGVIPKDDVKYLLENASFDLNRIYEIEQDTKHDVIAFTRAISEKLTQCKQWIHYGLTSTDVVDSAYGLLYQQANIILEKDIQDFLVVLKEKALLYKTTPCIGRTHGVHADVSCFGLKFALYYDEFSRHLKRFQEARRQIEVGKISGAVGTFANTSPFIQDEVCRILQLNSANISTQTLQRDRHAQYYTTLALIASSIEKIGVEIRHLQKTEVLEVEEYFNKNQKGSSAMPHKRNPIASENMAGCARIMRGYAFSSFENIALWHERDISHSASERIISQDATTLLHYMLKRFTKVIKQLTVFEENIFNNIFKTHGVIFAQQVMTMLIKEKKYSREQAYDFVQPIAMKAWHEKKDFKSLLLQEKIIQEINNQKIEACFDLNYHLRYVEDIYKRVGIL